jgi:hypothetical protein
MKNKVFAMLVVLTMLLSVFVGSASAQAYNAHFTTSITYVNVGSAATTTLDLLFYANPGDLAPTSYTLENLEPNAAGSLFVGQVGVPIDPGFQGDAIMQSDQPMLVTLVQLPIDAGNVKNRALSNGFNAGAPQTLIATVLKNTFNTNSIFSVQNADSELNTVDINFYNTSADLVYSMTQDIEGGAAFYVDAGLIAGLGYTFNGSAVVMASRVGGMEDGAIVSSVMELGITSTDVKAFEGVATGGMKFYMPSAVCNKFGGQNTSYAVQNTSLTDATDVTVTFYDTTGNITSQTKNIGPGAKASFLGCDSMAQDTYGSAIVEAATQPVIAIGKVYGAGVATAFNGVAVGVEKSGLPYVRWANATDWAAGTKQRTNITIQNVGEDLAAGAVVTIEYVGPDGAVLGTHTYTVGADGLPNGAKFNTSAAEAGLTEFGYYGSVFGGAAIITGPAGSELAAVARVSTQITPGVLISEDYNGQAIP